MCHNLTITERSCSELASRRICCGWVLFNRLNIFQNKSLLQSNVFSTEATLKNFIRTISSHAIIVLISYYSFNPVKFYMESTSSSLISLSMNKWNEQIWVGRTLKYCSLPPMCTVYFYHYQKKFHSFPTITPIKVYNTKRNDSFVSYLQGKRYILTYVAPN